MESPPILPPYLSESSDLELESYLKEVGKDLQIPWCLEQEFAKSDCGPKTAQELFRLGALEFCPENGGDKLSIDVMMKAVLQVRRLYYTPEVPSSSILMIPLEFMESVFELNDFKDYSEDSWNAFQNFLKTKWPQDQTKKMIDILPSLPLEDKNGSVIFCTGTDDNHIVFNVAKSLADEKGQWGSGCVMVEIYDSNPYGSGGNRDVCERRQRVMAYVSLFSYIKAIENKNQGDVSNYKYPGSTWSEDLVVLNFKGCSLRDRMTTCQLGGSCYLHGCYHLLKHVLGPSLLLPPLSDMEQLLFGGLVNLHLLRTGRICTNYSKFLFKETQTLQEWRKCLHIGIAQKLKNITENESFFFRVLQTIRDSCETNYPPSDVLDSIIEIKALFNVIVVPLCIHPGKAVNSMKSFHFWVSLFTSLSIRCISRIKRYSVEGTNQIMEPGNGIQWYQAQVNDPIMWNQVLAYQSQITSNNFNINANRNAIPLKRLTIFPVIKHNFWAIVIFALSYNTSGDAMKMNLLVIDTEAAFSVDDRKILVDFIIEERIKKCISLCTTFNLQDLVVHYIRFEKPLVWQDQCCGLVEQDDDEDEEEKGCRLWETASNMCVLYAFSRISYAQYIRQMPHPLDESQELLFGCDCYHRLKSLENQTAAICEIAPFSFALALKEFFETS